MKRSFIILLHIGYWALFLLLVACFVLLLPGTTKQHSFSRLMAVLFLPPIGINIMLPSAIGFYIFYSFLFTWFLGKKKILAMCVAGLLACTLTAIFSIVLTAVTLPTHLAINNWSEKMSMICFIALLALVHGIIGLVMRGFISWYADIKWKEALRAKNFGRLPAKTLHFRTFFAGGGSRATNYRAGRPTGA